MTMTTVARLRQLALALTLLAGAGAAQAADLLLRAPQTVELGGLQTDNSTGPAGQSFAAPADSMLESITWWGFHGVNSGGPTFDQFAVLLDSVVQTGTLTSTPVILADSSVLTRYTLDVPDQPLTASSLSIVNDSLDVEWFWQDSAETTDRRAFLLTGALMPVPEPASAVLLLAGVAFLAAARTRRRR